MEFERLPKTAKPTRYTISLTPNFETFTFQGETTIEIAVETPENRIKLNICDLSIHNLKLEADGGALADATHTISKEAETLTIETREKLQSGKYRLSITYTGNLNSNLRGFYRILNVENNNYGAATYFTPSEARKCFPCFDEPSFKAIFEVSVITNASFTTLSNMPVKKTTKISDVLNKIEFESTPIMSTYLLVIVIGDYAFIEGVTKTNVKIRIYAAKNKIAQLKFALDVAIKALEFYIDFFKVNYPLPKLDLIALAELEVGAMEHWGLITFRETLLCVDEFNTSSAVKERVALTIAHELAHQWFGNLVTMDWWTHIWLNEGYASFIQFLAIDELDPKLNVWNSFITSTYQIALELDSLSSSHRIEIPIGHPSEINEIFDVISYKKGCSIIRMLFLYIGNVSFKQGMHEYMLKYQYKNTITNELWECLEKASNKPIKKIMSTWTLQTGYPIIKTAFVEEEKGVRVFLEQERFYLNKKLSANNKSLWVIPISIVVSNGGTYKLILDKPKSDLLIPNVTLKDWVKLNYNSYGFYRVLYPGNMLENLTIAIEKNKLSNFDRLGLVNDVFQLARSGFNNTIEAFKLLKAFKSEENATIWMSVITNLNQVKLILRETKCEIYFKEYINNLLIPVYNKLGWDCKDDEEHDNKKLRSLVLKELVVNNYEKVIETAKEKFNQFVNFGVKLHPDIRLPVYQAAVQNISTSIELLYKKFNKTDSTEEKYDIIIALACSKNSQDLLKLLTFIMSDGVRIQDRLAFLQLVVISSQNGGNIVWKYFKENFLEFKKTYENTFMIRDFISAFKRCFTKVTQAQEFDAFFKENPISGTEMSISQTVEIIKVSSDWFERDYNAIEAFFKINVNYAFKNVVIFI